ncbi:MAG: hypothetical protein ACYCUM_13650 [Solirubrobacteraceae bacterium]
MTTTETEAGTRVIEMSAQEHRDFLDREARQRLGISVEEFEHRYAAGELDDADPDVPLMAVLAGLGQHAEAVPA